MEGDFLFAYTKSRQIRYAEKICAFAVDNKKQCIICVTKNGSIQKLVLTNREFKRIESKVLRDEMIGRGVCVEQDIYVAACNDHENLILVYDSHLEYKKSIVLDFEPHSVQLHPVELVLYVLGAKKCEFAVVCAIRGQVMEKSVLFEEDKAPSDAAFKFFEYEDTWFFMVNTCDGTHSFFDLEDPDHPCATHYEKRDLTIKKASEFL